MTKASNDNLVNEFVFNVSRQIKEGDYSFYHRLAEAYQNGDNVEKNTGKAIEAYEKFCKIHRKARVKIDLVETLVTIGNLHMELGNKYLAADSYIEAALQIAEDYKPDLHEKMIRKYKIKSLLKKTGIEVNKK